jgi:hypothetical protein
MAPLSLISVFVLFVGVCANGYLRDEYIRLLKMAVSGVLFDELGQCDLKHSHDCTKSAPFDMALRKKGNDWPIAGHTMVGLMRLDNVQSLLEDVITNQIPGDFMELGVWRGGVCIFARAVMNALHARQRNVHVFDAFEKLPGYTTAVDYLAVSEDQVRHNFEKYNLKEGVYFHKGLFKDTVPGFSKNFTGQIAVLRVDGNFYDSYQDAMYYLYDKVPVGGYVIFDDVMSHVAVMDFWKDFKREQNVPENLTPIDDHSAYFKKTKESRTDFKYFRAPRDANKP